ncbi:hypothetical protein ACIA7S_28790 [Streptomyces sp. NPDC051643]|uniref:hypothetical protein n=1 Tax=Streptomyces sp. NPDC051643 TaxID=3365665 RepID=UPI0037A034D5
MTVTPPAVDPAAPCSLCGHREDQHDTEPDGTRPCRTIGHPKGVPCAECRRLTDTAHFEDLMAMRDSGDAFDEAWAAYRVTFDHVRDQIGPGWPAFFTDVHQSALASALVVLRQQPEGTASQQQLDDALAALEAAREDLVRARPWSEHWKYRAITMGVRLHYALERHQPALDSGGVASGRCTCGELHPCSTRRAAGVMPPCTCSADCPARNAWDEPLPLWDRPNQVREQLAEVLRTRLAQVHGDPWTGALKSEEVVSYIGLTEYELADAILHAPDDLRRAIAGPKCAGCGNTGACAGGPCAHPDATPTALEA